MPLYLAFTISQLSDTAPYTIQPLQGARVDIWSCNASGLYSDEESQGTPGVDFLRGYQISSSHGVVEFLTNYPGWYSGRTLHVHVRVRTYDTSGTETYNFATQVFFDEAVTAKVYANAPYAARAAERDTNNSDDRVLTGGSYNGSPETDAGDYTMLKLSDDGTHVMGSFHIVVDLSDTADEDPTDGSETGGAGGAPGGGTPPGGGGTPPGGGGGPPTGGPPPTGTGSLSALGTGQQIRGRGMSAGILGIGKPGTGGIA